MDCRSCKAMRYSIFSRRKARRFLKSCSPDITRPDITNLWRGTRVFRLCNTRSTGIGTISSVNHAKHEGNAGHVGETLRRRSPGIRAHMNMRPSRMHTDVRGSQGSAAATGIGITIASKTEASCSTWIIAATFGVYIGISCFACTRINGRRETYGNEHCCERQQSFVFHFFLQSS